MFDRILIANRGEIACRIARTCHELGIDVVAVYSEADRDALHVALADQAVCIGPAPASESYLDVDRIVRAAQQTGAQAIHPGYGFLSENPALAEACARAGVTFIGPPAAAMAAMGDKTEARARMRAAGVPVVPGTEALDEESLAQAAEEVGFPVLLKAAAGGGGKGMRVVRKPDELLEAYRAARRTAASAFGDERVYLEKFVENPRHIEIQVLADAHGHCIHLFERECSVQRRHQKIVEEAPATRLSEATRRAMGEVAVRAARAIDYTGAGTVEFIVDAEERFYFLEMNTRLQVEHPVTEMTVGVDLVAEQLRVAAGEPLGIDQASVTRRGHAIECRIYAEDPARDFLPSPGRIDAWVEPAGPGVRIDSGVTAGAEVPSMYDPLIAKLVTWAPTRAHALARMRRALRELRVTGIRTNIPALLTVLDAPAFAEGRYDTGLVDALALPRARGPQGDARRAWSAVAALAALGAGVLSQGRRRAAGGLDGSPVPSAWRTAGRRAQLRQPLRRWGR